MPVVCNIILGGPWPRRVSCQEWWWIIWVGSEHITYYVSCWVRACS